MSEKSKLRDIFVVGMALFAMFLGAANIIFPPYLGARAGSSWLIACAGFTLTGTGLPLLGILATAKAGGQTNDIGKRVSPGFGIVLNTVLLIFIGPLFAIPRTAATTIELSLLPFLPESLHTPWVRIGGLLIFFVICITFVMNPTNALDRVGRFLTPLLVLFLLTLIVISIVSPAGEPVATLQDMREKGVLNEGFTTGYQTMDALASIVFCTSMYMTLNAKGYVGATARRMMVPVSIICGIGTAVVYGGFIWIGASGSAVLQAYSEHTALTVAAVNLLAGSVGRGMLALIIFLACCTTGIGLIFAASGYFYEMFRGHIRYRAIVVILTAVSFGLSIIGVNGMIRLAAPLLEIMYPVVIILIILNLFGSRIKYNYAYYGALLGAVPAMILNILRMSNATKDFANAGLACLPFGLAGFGAFPLALAGAVIGSLIAWRLDCRGRLKSRLKVQKESDLPA